MRPRSPETASSESGSRRPARATRAGRFPPWPSWPASMPNLPVGCSSGPIIPTWSTLAFSDGGSTFALSSGRTTDWRQSIDLRTGVITTTALWTAPDGQVTRLSYQVLTDRARAHVGLVQLTLQPRWTGNAAVTDVIDGSPATLSTQVGKAWVPSAHRDWVTVQTVGTGIEAAIASQLAVSDNVRATTTVINQSADQSVGQELSFRVTAGQRYTFTKYVGVVTSQESSCPDLGGPIQQRRRGRHGISAPLVTANDAAWATLWSGRIDVLGNPTLASEVNASEFYLWSSTRDGVDWSISPAGLSSNGYDGHIFWDAETWMYPALLAQHPDLAAGMNAYRYAAPGGGPGACLVDRLPGQPLPVGERTRRRPSRFPHRLRVFTEGLYEQHVTSDIALAQWQYYLATGDRTWLAQRGWPVLSRSGGLLGLASRPRGRRHLRHRRRHRPGRGEPRRRRRGLYECGRQPPLARSPSTAARILGPRRRLLGAHRVGTRHPHRHHGRRVPGVRRLRRPAGQAGRCHTAAIPAGPCRSRRASHRSNVDYYVPRTDPGGPSMSDSVASIDSAALGTAGVRQLRVHRAQRATLHPRRLRPVLRDQRRRRLHLHDRHRRLPAGVPLRLLRPALELGRRAAVSEPHRPARPGWSCTTCPGTAVGSPWPSAGDTTTVTLHQRRRPPRRVGCPYRHVVVGHDLTDRHPPPRSVRHRRRGALRQRPRPPRRSLVRPRWPRSTAVRPPTGVRSPLPATLTVPLPGGRTVSTATLDWGQTVAAGARRSRSHRLPGPWSRFGPPPTAWPCPSTVRPGEPWPP